MSRPNSQGGSVQHPTGCGCPTCAQFPGTFDGVTNSGERFDDWDRALLRQAKLDNWPTGWLLERLRNRRGRHTHKWGPWTAVEQSQEYRQCSSCGLKEWD